MCHASVRTSLGGLCLTYRQLRQAHLPQLVIPNRCLQLLGEPDDHPRRTRQFPRNADRKAPMSSKGIDGNIAGGRLGERKVSIIM